jgi:hypothetical protein
MSKKNPVGVEFNPADLPFTDLVYEEAKDRRIGRGGSSRNGGRKNRPSRLRLNDTMSYGGSPSHPPGVTRDMLGFRIARTKGGRS